MEEMGFVVPLVKWACCCCCRRRMCATDEVGLVEVRRWEPEEAKSACMAGPGWRDCRGLEATIPFLFGSDLGSQAANMAGRAGGVKLMAREGEA